MFDSDRIIVWFNSSIVERVDSSMTVCSMKTSGEVHITHTRWEWLTKNDLKILLFERETSIFDFDLMDFLDLGSGSGSGLGLFDHRYGPNPVE